jgi:O-antigen/teichoic acid export membrane protein
MIAGLAKSIASGRTTLGAVLQTSASNILIQAANVCSGIITARSLGPGGRGALAAIIMWPQFLSYAMSLGIPAASVYRVRSDPENASGYAAAASISSVVMGLVAVLIGLIVIPYSLHTYSPGVVHFSRLVVWLAPLSLLGVTLSTLAQAAGAFRRSNIYRVAQPFSIVVVLLVVWKTAGLSAYSAALTYLLAGVPITIWNFIWVYRHFHPRLDGAMRSIRKLSSFGVRVWGADLLGTVSNQVDRVLIVSMLEPRLMGLYVVSQSVAGLLNVLPAAVCTILTPKVTGRPVAEIVLRTGSAVRLTMVGLTLGALPLFFGGGMLLKLVYGNKFDGAAAILRILLGEAILDGMTAVCSQAFLAAGVPGTVAFLQGAGLITAVPLMYWMIPRWGLQGAAYALLTSTAIRFLFVASNFPMRFKMRPPSLLPRMSDLEFLRRG